MKFMKPGHSLNGKRGQSLIEMALLLPVVFLTFVLMLQLLWLIRVKLVFQLSASQLAHTVAVGRYVQAKAIAELAWQFRNEIRQTQGIPSTPKLTIFRMGRLPSYPFPSVGSWSGEGKIASVNLSFHVFPKWFLRSGLPSPKVIGYAELPFEPEIPVYEE
ncbi:MAG: TadE family protein [Elusimicrobiota bacterium]|jgi:hypothetical protein